jgi:hypothetical protein
VGLSPPIVSRLKTPIGGTTSHFESSAELWKSFDATLHARVCVSASLNGVSGWLALAGVVDPSHFSIMARVHCLLRMVHGLAHGSLTFLT